MDMFRSVNKISLTALCLVASIFFITPAQAKDKLNLSPNPVLKFMITNQHQKILSKHKKLILFYGMG